MGDTGLCFSANGTDYDGFPESPEPSLPHSLSHPTVLLEEVKKGVCGARSGTSAPILPRLHSPSALVRQFAIQLGLLWGPGSGLDLVGGQIQGQASCQRASVLSG